MKRALGSWIALVVFALVPSHAEARGGSPSVYWRGRLHRLDELPAAMSPAARAAVEEWAEWAAQERYRLDLDERGRVLLASPEGNGRHARWLELTAKTTDVFEELLPAPPRRAAAADRPTTPSTGAPEPGVLPEDPEEAPKAPPPVAAPTAAPPARWGTVARELDGETAVLFILRNEKSQAALLERLAHEFEHLQAWTEEARALTGFVLEAPLLGAYLLDAQGQEEWNPDNELVNRLAQLLVLCRFGQEPYWLVQGFAWHVEARICGAIYCYPYRAEFVWASEHGSWDSELARRYREHEGAVEIEDFAAWKRGKFENEPAQLSYGMLTFLARKHGAELSGFLEALRLFRDRDDRIAHPDGTWERNPHYQMAPAEQARLLGESFGKSVLTEAADYFRAGLPKAEAGAR